MRTLIAVLVASLLVPAAAEAGRRPPCSKGGKTVDVNRVVRVFEKGSRLIACTKADRRRDVLARSRDDGYVTSSDYADVALAGSFVAWSETTTDVSCKAMCPPGYEPTRRSVTVRDIATDDERSASVELISELVLTTTGSAAWIEGGEVLALRDEGVSTLDAGDVSSLEASRTRVSWLNAGELRSAAL